MIISASRRTDIPAFFGEWFANRIAAGYFCSVNPFNPNQRKIVSLLPGDVTAFVFCTKNPRPFFKQLDRLDNLGYRYLFQFTLNDYPRLFEPAVPAVAQRIEAFRALSERIGPKRVIWRYDPMILSTVTPLEYHLEKIDRLAGQLSGYTDRMIISFLDFYQKVESRIRKSPSLQAIQFRDWLAAEQRSELDHLCARIAATAAQHRMKVFTCAEAVELSRYHIAKGACIDGALITEIFGIPAERRKAAAQRENCQCVAAADMGVYNTCKFQCIYCYANAGRNNVEQTLARHDPAGASLV